MEHKGIIASASNKIRRGREKAKEPVSSGEGLH